MVPSGILGLPRDENAGSVRQERWIEEHRSKSEPVPKLPEEKQLRYTRASNGTTVEGIMIEGEYLREVEIEVDDGFDECPLPELLGFPLMMKRLPLTPKAQMATNQRWRSLVMKLITEPGIGIPLHWNVSDQGVLPPIMVARPDGVKFGEQDWNVLIEFHDELAEEFFDDEQLDQCTPSKFARFVSYWAKSCACTPTMVPMAFMDLAPEFASRYPMGMKVKAQGLSARAELNGKWGLVARYDEAKGRVGVEFPRPHGLLSLKPQCILVDPKVRAEKLNAVKRK